MSCSVRLLRSKRQKQRILLASKHVTLKILYTREVARAEVSYRRNHSKPSEFVSTPDEIFEVSLTCPPDHNRVHGKLNVFGVGDRTSIAKSNLLRQEVESLCRHSVTQEAIVNSVLDKVVEVYRPDRATVRGDFDSGEGLRVSIEAVYDNCRRDGVGNFRLEWKRL